MFNWLRSLLGESNQVVYLRSEMYTANRQLETIRTARWQLEAKLQDRAKGCKLEIYKDKAKEYRWRLKSRNHCIVAEGGESYKRFENLDKALNLVIDVIGVVDMDRLDKVK